jgi:hypothetical protein
VIFLFLVAISDLDEASRIAGEENFLRRQSARMIGLRSSIV